MTGPEHYLRAEVLALTALSATDDPSEDPAVGAAIASLAQVHATLALAAATALSGLRDGMPFIDGLHWAAAVAENKEGAR